MITLKTCRESVVMTRPGGLTPRSLPWLAAPLKHEKAGPPRLSAFVSEARPALPRNSALIEGLRQRIHDIERHTPVLAPVLARVLEPVLEPGSNPNRPTPWTLGIGDIDAYLGPAGLNASAVHEIKPATAGAGAAIASMGFALRLASRRLQQISATDPDGPRPRILWCVTRNNAHETGELYAPGLAALGLDPACFLMVETARTSEALWAMEEGLKCAGLALVIGQPGAIDLTPARRLSLAAEHASTPCLLLTPIQAPPAAATSSRWRIHPAPSAAHRFDRCAPDRPRLTATLERCQHSPGSSLGDVSPSFSLPKSFVLEWPHGPDETAHRVSMAAALADRTLSPPDAKCRTG